MSVSLTVCGPSISSEKGFMNIEGIRYSLREGSALTFDFFALLLGMEGERRHNPCIHAACIGISQMQEETKNGQSVIHRSIPPIFGKPSSNDSLSFSITSPVVGRKSPIFVRLHRSRPEGRPLVR